MIYVDGDLTTCCLDEHLENRLGNIREHTLAELWFGPQVEAWRLAHVEGRFEDSGPLCTRCNWRSAGALPAQDAAAWLARFQAGAALSSPAPSSAVPASSSHELITRTSSNEHGGG